MLRISQQDSSDGAKRYYSVADYFSEGQELVGAWGGVGAKTLGLEGVVDKASFDRLCDNLNPMDGKQLTVRTRGDRTVLYDFTWSVPKSVSLLYSMTGDEQILDAFRSAAHETMLDIESEMKTRVRRNGKDEDRTTGNMVWAEFIHKTSRPVEGVPDPQLHIHTAVFNATFDEKERRWKAGQFRELKRDAPYFQAAFRVRLAGKLQDLGFGVERKRDDFEIAGLSSPALLKRFSRRTQEIEKAYEKFLGERLAELGYGVLREGRLELDGAELSPQQIIAEAKRLGITDPHRKAELGAETREKKNKELTWDELRKEWDSRLTDKERQQVAAVHRREVAYTKAVQGERVAVDYAIEHSFVREAVVPERKLLTEALKRGVGSVTVEETKRELAKRPLIRGLHEGRAMATTKSMADAEKSLIAFARRGRGKCQPLGDPNRPLVRDWLNDGQKAAVRHVLGSRDRVMIIRGVAGTGKTTLQQEIGEALAAANVPVVAIAQSAAASRGVLREEAGFAEADTVARFLKDQEMQMSAQGGVVLVDEASLLATHDMVQLFKVAEDVGARVLLVGDKRQHRAVSAGEPLKLLETKAGLPVAEVTEILRQSGDYRKAAMSLSEGKTAEGFAELDKLGWIREVVDAERYQALASAYLAATLDKKQGGEGKTALVVTPTHAEAARVTEAVRSALKAKDKLGKEHELAVWVPTHLTNPQKADPANIETGNMLQFHQNVPGHKNGSRLVVAEGAKLPLQFANRFEVYRPARLSMAEGDRIRITANGRTKEGKHKVNNGDLYTIKGWTKQGDLVLNNNWVISKEFGHITHGVAVTSPAGQGKTVDKVLAAMSSQSFAATNQRTVYVAFTRGKQQVQVFTDDKKELLRAALRPDEPLSALEFAQSVRPRTTLRQRLHKHVATLRRAANFAVTHGPRLAERNRTTTLQREHAYER